MTWEYGLLIAWATGFAVLSTCYVGGDKSGFNSRWDALLAFLCLVFWPLFIPAAIVLHRRAMRRQQETVERLQDLVERLKQAAPKAGEGQDETSNS